MRRRFTEGQIIGFIREAEAGLAVKDLCREHGFSVASYYLWRSTFWGMRVSGAKRLRELEAENTRLKKLLAESMLESEITREAMRKSDHRTGTTVAGAGDDEPRTRQAPRVIHVELPVRPARGRPKDHHRVRRLSAGAARRRAVGCGDGA